MSNHSGSYMLNEVLLLLEDHGFFETLNSNDMVKFIHKVVAIGYDYDCNNGEILDAIGERIGICYSCLEHAKEFKDGVCLKCSSE